MLLSRSSTGNAKQLVMTAEIAAHRWVLSCFLLQFYQQLKPQLHYFDLLCTSRTTSRTLSCTKSWRVKMVSTLYSWLSTFSALVSQLAVELLWNRCRACCTMLLHDKSTTNPSKKSLGYKSEALTPVASRECQLLLLLHCAERHSATVTC